MGGREQTDQSVQIKPYAPNRLTVEPQQDSGADVDLFGDDASDIADILEAEKALAAQHAAQTPNRKQLFTNPYETSAKAGKPPDTASAMTQSQMPTTVQPVIRKFTPLPTPPKTPTSIVAENPVPTCLHPPSL